MTTTYSIKDLDTVAKQLINHSKSKTLVFNAEMGVGKTTLIKALVKALGSSDEVSSPTFSLVNEYRSDTDIIYHFDLYRVEDEEELYNFGIDEYIYSNNWVLVEWPDLLKPMLQEDYTIVSIVRLENEERHLSIVSESVN